MKKAAGLSSVVEGPLIVIDVSEDTKLRIVSNTTRGEMEIHRIVRRTF